MLKRIARSDFEVLPHCQCGGELVVSGDIECPRENDRNVIARIQKTFLKCDTCSTEFEAVYRFRGIAKTVKP